MPDDSDLNFEDDFVNAFCQFNGSITECECRTTHVCNHPNNFDWEEGELERWLEMAKTDDSIQVHDGEVYLPQIDIDGASYVYGCSCEGWRVYFDIMIKHRKEINAFSRFTDHTIKKALEQEKIMDILADDNLTLNHHGF